MRVPSSILSFAFLLTDLSSAFIASADVNSLLYGQSTTLNVHKDVANRNARSEKVHLKHIFRREDEEEPDENTLACNKCTRRCKRPKSYLDENDCKCKRCGPGTQPNAMFNGCIPNTGDPPDQDKKGKCKDGEILDPAEGGQDKNTENPVCIQDDQEFCEPGKVPQSRFKGDTTVKKKEDVGCGKDIPEDQKPKCKESEYRFVETDGENAKYSCAKTRKFDREKDSKFKDAKKRKKTEYADRKRREQEEKDKKAKEAKENRKKQRMGRCLCIVPLSFIPTDVAEFGYSADFFDEEFITSDDMMKYWPADMDDVPNADTDTVDTDDYVQKFLEAVNKDGWITNHIGPGARSAKIQAPSEESKDVSLVPSETGLTVHHHERRVVQVVIEAILAFLSRVGPILGRIGTGAARLAKLTKQGGIRIAKAGKSKAPRQKQQDAADVTSRSKNWRNCLQGAAPV